jgi:hypothetical protein
MSQSIDGDHEFLLLLQSVPLPLAGVHTLHQCRQLAKGLLERGVVGVGDGRVLEEVLDEEDIARDPLDGLDQEVIESQATLAVFGSLLNGVCVCVCVCCVCECTCMSMCVCLCVHYRRWNGNVCMHVWLMGVCMCSLRMVCVYRSARVC